MTAPQPGWLLTIADFTALSEDNACQWELDEGGVWVDAAGYHVLACGISDANRRPAYPFECSDA